MGSNLGPSSVVRHRAQTHTHNSLARTTAANGPFSPVRVDRTHSELLSDPLLRPIRTKWPQVALNRPYRVDLPIKGDRGASEHGPKATEIGLQNLLQIMEGARLAPVPRPHILGPKCPISDASPSTRTERRTQRAQALTDD